MNYIVIDFEYNQPYDFEKEEKGTSIEDCNFEIIQIGAVKLNAKLEMISEQNLYMKPQIYEQIHPYVEKLTGITTSLIENKATFPDLYEEFLEFLGTEPFTLCFWGSNDLPELFRNIAYYRLEEAKIPKEYINIQALVSKMLAYPMGRNIGLKNAVEALGLESPLQYHNALNDAIYTAKILQQIKPIPSHREKIRFPILKEKELHYTVDYPKLYRVMEKELGRKISKKEKNIFKKIYEYGKKGVFDLKNNIK